MNIKPNKSKALMLAQREIGALVHDSVLLEGINFTLPEISTLLEGVTVGGHKLSDQQIAVNQGNAWRFLFSSIKEGGFSMSKTFLFELHNIAAKEEALEWGQFRSGSVLIAGTTYEPPKTHLLDQKFTELVDSLDKYPNTCEGIYQKAIHVFLMMARTQFFYDVNKRTGRLMMNGILLKAGYPVINLSAKKQLEFNQLMLAFYESGDESDMQVFMLSCLDSRMVDIMNE